MCFNYFWMTRYKELNFSTLLSEVISKYGSLDALSFVDEKAITYEEMGKKIQAVKAFMRQLGLEKGDKIVIYSQNMPNWGIVYFAIHCAGMVVVPVLPEFSEHDLGAVIKHSEAKAVFVSQSLEAKLNKVDAENIRTIIRLNDFSIISTKEEVAIYSEDVLDTEMYIPAHKDELAVLLYTSGTTGEPKGVMHSQHSIIFNAIQSGKVQEILPGDRFLSVLPLSHTYENTIGFILPISKGANVTYLRKPPTASVLLPALKKVKPTLMLTVPLIIEKVYKNSILPQIQKKAFSRTLYNFKPTRALVHKLAGKKLYQTFGGELKFFGIGGAKLDASVERFLRDAKFPYAIGYGLTETAPLLAGSNPTQTRYQAIGPKVEDCIVKINNPDPKTGEGEIWAKGENVMLGYYKNEEKTREVLSPDGWFRTGDLGVYDKDGWLSHKGRLKNLIVGANGENIYPEEIESMINNFKHVVESLVIEKKGKLVAMVHFNREELEAKLRTMREEISNKFDEQMDECARKVDEIIDELSRELQEYVNARLNKYSRIQMLVVRNDPFQKTATQKIKRYLYC